MPIESHVVFGCAVPSSGFVVGVSLESYFAHYTFMKVENSSMNDHVLLNTEAVCSTVISRLAALSLWPGLSGCERSRVFTRMQGKRSTCR